MFVELLKTEMKGSPWRYDLKEKIWLKALPNVIVWRLRVEEHAALDRDQLLRASTVGRVDVGSDRLRVRDILPDVEVAKELWAGRNGDVERLDGARIHVLAAHGHEENRPSSND